jgi:hypothetical protein
MIGSVASRYVHEAIDAQQDHFQSGGDRYDRRKLSGELHGQLSGWREEGLPRGSFRLCRFRREGVG